MTRWLRVWGRWVILLSMSGWLFQAGCARIVQQELEVLIAPNASSTLINGSFLVNIFGPGVLQLFTH